MRKTLCVDFDGVLHAYTSGWQGLAVIADGPVPGAFEWLTRLVTDGRFEVCIYSARSKGTSGVSAMRSWFLNHGLAPEVFGHLQFPTQKPSAWLTIDDRCIRFEGTFPELDEVDRFMPWVCGQAAPGLSPEGIEAAG